MVLMTMISSKEDLMMQSGLPQKGQRRGCSG